jgi:hypothetical protein
MYRNDHESSLTIPAMLDQRKAEKIRFQKVLAAPTKVRKFQKPSLLKRLLSLLK